ncbi:PAS domain S-box protein [Saccharophagus degradans]|uniref:histidine kinase n=1 Tax=Saccharophagus degradans (strain 2-40 / ATCC 43961 / DSM 17024) TaxID=203122 RepID=Q21NS5_SACD2|nr:PAS domain S-box protein [Saccharophagus degradans]ABD79654.1 CHASE [Saccharophagus degradans 2-40]
MINWLGNESTQMRFDAAQIAVVAVAYHALAQLGLYFAIPPGFATVFWPASGVALAAVMLRGPWMMLGVLLGSFSVNLYISLQLNDFAISAANVLVALGIACSSALQAGLGAWLISYWLKRQNGRLTQLRHLLVLVGLGGPIGCMLAATGGTTILVATGVMLPEQWWHNWLMWWLGDTLGVVVIAPALVILAQSPKSVSILRKTQVCIPLAVLFILLAFGYSRFESHTLERFDKEINNLTDGAYLDVQSKLMDYERSLIGVVSLFRNSEFVTDEEFANQTIPLINSSPSLIALQWVPRVTRDQLAAFVIQARSNGLPTYTIHNTENNELTETAERDVFYPVRYVRPLQGNEVMLGFDMYSNEVRRNAIDLVLTSGRSVASAPIDLLQLDNEKGFLIIFPQHPAKSKNIIVGVFKVRPVFRTVTHQLASFPLDLTVTDANSGDEVFQWGGKSAGVYHLIVDRFSVVKTVAFGQRTWIMKFTPPLELISGYLYRNMAPLLIAAVAFIGLSSLFLLSIALSAMTLEDELQTKESDLKAEENFLNTVLNNLPCYVDVREAEALTCVRLNRLAKEFWQINTSERGLGYDAFYDSEEAAFQREEDLRTISTGNKVEIGIRKIATPNGYKWLKAKKVPIFDGNNNIKYVLSIYDDVTEQKEEHETFNSVVENLPNALLIVNEYSRIEYANPAAYKKFPLDRKLTPLSRIIPEKFHHKHAELFKQFIAQPESKQMAPGRDLLAVDINGEEIPVEITLTSLVWLGRACVMATIHDLSDRHRAEQAEIEAKHFFSSLLNDMGESIWSVNAEGIATYVNPALCEQLGYSADELVGKNVDHLIGASEQNDNLLASLNPVYVAMHKQEKIVERNKTLIAKNKRAVPVDYIVTPQINLAGGIEGAVVVAADVSERIAALERLQAQHELISLGLDASGLGSWQWVADIDQIICDDNLHRIFGMPIGTFVGGYREFLALVHPDDRERVETVTNKHSHTTNLYEIIYRIVRPDGLVRWIHVRAKYLIDKAANPIKMQGVAWDCTSNKQMELELKKNEKTIDGVNKQFVDYSDMVSKQVLQPTQQAVEVGERLLRNLEKLSTEEMANTLRELNYINTSIVHRVSDLSLYAAIVGARDGNEPVETVEVVNNLLNTLLPVFKAENIDCRIETPLPRVNANAQYLEEIFKRLIDNAITHNNSEVKKVRIGCSVRDGQPVFYVADNGKGLSAADKQRWFTASKVDMKDESTRDKSTQDKNTADEPMSLKIVATIVDKLNGKLWAEDEAGRGTVVYFAV